jgi:hypothetical protein
MKQAWESSVDEHLNSKALMQNAMKNLQVMKVKSTSQVKFSLINCFFPHGRNQTSGPLWLIELRTFDHKNKTN